MVQSMTNQLRGMVPHIHIELHPPQFITRLGEKARCARERVRGWFLPTAETPSLNAKFLEPIHIKNCPISRKEFLVSVVMVIAGATIAAYSIAFLSSAALIAKTASVLGLSLGITMIGVQARKTIALVTQFQSRVPSKEEQLLKEYNKYSNGEIALKFRELVGRDLSSVYTTAQVTAILKDTKATSLERAILPALVRFAVAKACYDGINTEHRPSVETITLREEYTSRRFVRYVGPVSAHEYLSRYDVEAFRQEENMHEQKLYTKKIEAAFELAVLLYPGMFTQTALNQLGAICDYSQCSGFWIGDSQLPFFFGKQAQAAQRTSPATGIESVLYRDMAGKSLDQLATLLAVPQEVHNTMPLPTPEPALIQPPSPMSSDAAVSERSSHASQAGSPRTSPLSSPPE